MKKLIGFFAAMFPLSALANPACPICTVAIGAALPIAQRMGVPADVVGLWAGALLTLLGYWAAKYFDRRGWHFRGRNALLIAISVAMIGFVYISQVKYSPCTYLGFISVDPIIFGAVLGMILFILSEKLYDWMKVKNGGRAHFPFEKVVLPVVVLIVASMLMTLCL